MRFIVKLIIALIFFLPHIVCAQKIDKKYTNFKNQYIVEYKKDHLPFTENKTRKILTTQGQKQISFTEGYRILYGYNNQPFLNLKIESFSSSTFKTDSINTMGHIKLMDQEKGSQFETFEVNGCKLTGVSKNTLSGQTLGTYVFFPEKDLVIYLYFYNSKIYKSIDDFKKARDSFIKLYTDHI